MIKPFGISGILAATSLAFIVNLFLKTGLVTKKIIKNVKHSELIKKYSILVLVFLIFSLLLYKLEAFYLSLDLNLITCVLLLFATFVSILLITFGVLYLVNEDTRKLFERVKGLVRRKVGS